VTKTLDQFRDSYSRNARLKPALLAILPLGAVALLIGLSVSIVTGALAGPLTVFGMTALVVEIGRDFGKKKEPGLFKSWGGKPSVTKLRHRDSTLNQHTRTRYHSVAESLLNCRMPTASDELQDSVGADSVYEAYSNLLLERTRDKKKFPLIFEELTNYGFRRNLWGLKPFAVVIAVVSLAVQIGYVIASWARHAQIGPVNTSLIAMNVLLLMCWLFVVNRSWVQRSADAYADKLLAASEVLGQDFLVGAKG
jgi:putative effector of murein hydrolase LrgA (UPF0299 family)